MITYFAVGRRNMDGVVYVFQNLRDADRREITLSHGPDVWGAIVDSVSNSEQAEVVYSNGTPVAIRGIGMWQPSVGCPWMVGTPALEHLGRSLVREGRRWVQYQLTRYDTLANFVHAENTKAKAWLKAIGFTLGATTPKNFQLFYANSNVPRP